MKQRGQLLAFVFVAAVAAGCTRASQPAAENPPAAAAPVVDAAKTSEVLARHKQTFGAQDIEGIMADYAPDAVIYTPNGAVRGADAIRQMFQTMFVEWGKPGTTFELKQEIVDGRYAYIFWNAETADNRYEGAMDGFVIENAKIVAQFFAGKITPKTAAQK